VRVCCGEDIYFPFLTFLVFLISFVSLSFLSPVSSGVGGVGVTDFFALSFFFFFLSLAGYLSG